MPGKKQKGVVEDPKAEAMMNESSSNDSDDDDESRSLSDGGGNSDDRSDVEDIAPRKVAAVPATPKSVRRGESMPATPKSVRRGQSVEPPSCSRRKHGLDDELEPAQQLVAGAAFDEQGAADANGDPDAGSRKASRKGKPTPAEKRGGRRRPAPRQRKGGGDDDDDDSDVEKVTPGAQFESSGWFVRGLSVAVAGAAMQQFACRGASIAT